MVGQFYGIFIIYIMSRHHTSLPLATTSPQLSYQDSLLTLGSCFAQNIGQRLQNQLYNILINPFGILYNPLSISESLGYLLNESYFEEKDLLWCRDAWHSLQHHSSFSGTNKTHTLNHINNNLREARQHLQQTTCLFLTFGTAWVYTWKMSGQIVSNCHRFPAAQFERRRLSVEEIVTALLGVLLRLHKQQEHLNVILTVSPIRHLKDGFVENQVSKATLILAVQQLVEQLDFCHYFPAYELLLDDLRDYRYYGRDLVHPNDLAIDYIWEAFEQCHLISEEGILRKQVAKLQQAANHRPYDLNSQAHQRFLQKQLSLLDKLAPQLPKKTYSQLKAKFSAQMLKLL